MAADASHEASEVSYPAMTAAVEVDGKQYAGLFVGERRHWGIYKFDDFQFLLTSQEAADPSYLQSAVKGRLWPALNLMPPHAALVVDQRREDYQGSITGRPGSAPGSTQMQKLECVGPTKWRFRWPHAYWEESEKFEEAMAAQGGGASEEVMSALRRTLQRYPEHLDAMVWLGFCLDESGREHEAVALYERAVALGRLAFPQTFRLGRDRLEWLWRVNWPFLNALSVLMAVKWDAGRSQTAVSLGRELLELNPNDESGNRCLLTSMLLLQKRYAEVVETLERYPDDCHPETLYGRALALFAVRRYEDANNALRDAIVQMPLVPDQLLKDPPPWGDAEAHFYREAQGNAWTKLPGALKWLDRVLAEDRDLWP